MSYKLIYTIPFASVSNKPMLLEVLEESYEGEPTELIGGATPFTVSIEDDDFLYSPLRFSTGRLKLVGSDYLQNIYSTDYQQYKVNLKQNEVIIWTGYIKPEVYTQDYSSVLFELDVECVSAMSTLEFIDYKKSGDRYTFVSLFDLIKQCVSASGGNYSSIYIPHTYGKNKSDFDSWSNVLSEMTISEQNFFDEEEKPMKQKEVLEEVCKFLNWTCVDYKGDLYFVDIDHIGEYYKYTPDFSSYTKATINSNVVQNIGFAGSGHTLDILGGYNKVTVKDSNYNINQLFPEEDFDSLNYYLPPYDVRKTNSTFVLRRALLKPKLYKTYHYTTYGDTINEEVTESSFEWMLRDKIPEMMGAYFVKYDTFNRNADGSTDKTDYNYKDVIALKVVWQHYTLLGQPDWFQALPVGLPLLTFEKQLPNIAYGSVALGIEAGIELFREGSAADVPGFQVGEITAYKLQPVKMYIKFSIGDKYYNGSSWVNEPSMFSLDFENVEKGGIVKNKSNKTLEMPFNGLGGYIIDLSEIVLIGEAKFEIVGFHAEGVSPNDHNTGCHFNCYVHDLKITNKVKDDLIYINPISTDRIYKNIANEKYTNELDNIEFKITTHNSDDLSYSKVVMGDDFLTNNLYSTITNTNERPEELLIKRIINQYKATKIKLTQILKYDESISPLTVMYDNYMYMVNKKFAITGGEIDYKNESFTVKMIEKK